MFVIKGVEYENKINNEQLRNVLKECVYPTLNAEVVNIENEYLSKLIQVIKIKKNIDRPYSLNFTFKGKGLERGLKYFRDIDSSKVIPPEKERTFINQWTSEDKRTITLKNFLIYVLIGISCFFLLI